MAHLESIAPGLSARTRSDHAGRHQPVMTSIYFPNPDLLQKLPLTRAAYSHRTAWILASLSWLAYQRLPGESDLSLDELIQQITEAAKRNGRSQIRELIVRYQEAGQSANQTLLLELEGAGFTFVQGFDSRAGTQAFLAKLTAIDDQPPMLILTFRGTETTKINDLRADANVALQDAPSGGRVHPGFYQAFESVSLSIQQCLNQHDDGPFYCTGHSLGGALALVASRYLQHPKWAATYTFGGPRVGDEAFFNDFRIPVYRVVNGADVVARLPFGEWLNVILGLIRLIPLNGTYVAARWLRKRLLGYTHHGSSIYLSDAIQTLPDASGLPYADLQVIQDPEFLWRVNLIARRVLRNGFGAFIQDHDIKTYAGKLYANAQRRNS